MGKCLFALACIAGLAGSARADEVAGPPTLVGLTPASEVRPDSGLLALAVASDGAGLFAYAQSDAASHASIHVIDVATGSEVRSFDVSDFTAAPSALWFAGKGIVVLGPTPDGDASTARAALFDGKGKNLHTFPGGDRVVVTARKGKRFVAVRTGTSVARYELSKKGKRLGKPRKLAGLLLDHWGGADGMIAIGTAEGQYDEKQDIRSPDDEGALDLADPSAKLVRRAIPDPMEHARRWEALAKDGDAGRFARVASNLAGVELWNDEARVTVTLDQPWDQYDPKSLVWGVGDDGAMWIGASVDPWNRAAVARKRADVEYFDVYQVSDDGKATRIGRRLAGKTRFVIGAAAGKLWMLERNAGFDGAKALAFFTTS